MKILKAILITFVILVVVVFIGILIFLKTVDVNRFKSEITKQISSSLGREAVIDKLAFDFSLLKGIILNMDGFSIANDPGIAQPLVSVKRLRLDLDLMAFVKERKILVSNVNIMSPQLVVVRDPSGQINLQKLAQAQGAQTSSPSSSSSAAPAASTASAPNQQQQDFLETLQIKKIFLNQGEIYFLDQSVSQDAALEVNKIDVLITDFSLKERFNFSADLGLLSEIQNVNAEGYVQIDLSTQQVRLDDVQVTVDMNQMEQWQSLHEWVPQLREIERFGGTFEVSLSHLIANPAQVSVLNGSARLKDGKVKAGRLKTALDKCQMAVDFTENNLDLPAFSCSFGQGRIHSTAQAKDYMKMGPFEGKVDIENIGLHELVPSNIPVKVVGNLNGKAVFNSVSSDPAIILQSINGNAGFNVLEGKIEDINVLKTFLGGISMIPNIGDKLEANLPEKYKVILQRPDTVFDRIEGTADIKSGQATLKNVEIVADGFKAGAQGVYDLVANQLSLNGGLAVLDDLSASLVTAVPELNPLLNQQNEVFIPIAPYQGPADKVRIMPDLNYLTKKIVVGRGRQELENLIDRAIGRDEETVPEGQPQGQQPSSEENIEKKIIGDILDGIFGK